ncbi:extracellular solute-binding protein [Actinosynnema sp. NPDC023794]
MRAPVRCGRWLASALVLVALVSCTSPTVPRHAVALWMYPIFPDAGVSRAFWADVERRFEDAHPDVDLRIELLPWENNNVKVATAFAAGRPPDLVLFRPEQVADYAARGLLQPVDDVLGPVAGELSKSTLDASSHGGRAYLVPLYQLAMTMACNRRVLTSAGFEHPPSTWAEVRVLADRLADRGMYALDYPAGLQVSLNLTFYPLLWQAGGSVYTSDGTRSAVNSPEGVRALEFLVDLYRRGAIAQSAVTQPHDPARGPMGRGQAACSPLTTLAELRQLKRVLGADVVAPAPPLADAERVGFGYPSGLVLTARSGSPDDARKFLRFMLRADVLSELCAKSGFLPTRPSAACARDDPDAQAFAAQLDVLFPGEPRASAPQVAGLVAPHVQAALLGDESPSEALDAAAREVDALLERGGP